jgi:type IV pilus assembly protein PilQ
MHPLYSICLPDGLRLSPKAAWLFCLFLAAAILSGGCATESATTVKSRAAASFITDFLAVEDAETFSVVVKGDRPLTYTAMKQSSPPAIYLKFPQTGLDQVSASYPLSDNAAVAAIRATESFENGREAHVFLDLKQDTPYTVTAEGSDVRIVFAKTKTSLAGNGKARKKVPGDKTAPAKGILSEVIVTPNVNEVTIRVIANEMVRDYRTFTIETPPKIVVDCFGMQSIYERQEKISVKSSIVSRVRHFAHPDMVRVVAETQSVYLTSYSVQPTEDGFIIIVGKK